MNYYKGKVTGGRLRMRNQPGGTQITTIPDETRLAVLSDGSGWAHTYYKMYEGYVDEDYLTNQGEAEYWQYLFGLTNLYRGCSNSLHVQTLQRYLVRYGHLANTSTACDGVFGVNTENAVKSFQRACNLTADGIVGDRTKEALDSSSPW